MSTSRILFMLLVTIAVIIASEYAKGEAMDEVNMQRKNYGLPPLTESPELTRFAQMKAEWQARHLIDPKRGYNGHEGPRFPDGCSEGTGVHEPSFGWASCLMRVHGSHIAGAGVAIGADGKRYMCLVVKGQGHREHITSHPNASTAHLTPRAPRVPWNRRTITTEPSNTWFTRTNYPPTYEQTIGTGGKRPMSPIVQRINELKDSPPICPGCGKRHW